MCSASDFDCTLFFLFFIVGIDLVERYLVERDGWHEIIATARVLPKATQRELFRLGAYPRFSQSHYRQRYFSEL